MCSEENCITLRDLRVSEGIQPACIYVNGAPGKAYGTSYASQTYGSAQPQY